MHGDDSQVRERVGDEADYHGENGENRHRRDHRARRFVKADVSEMKGGRVFGFRRLALRAAAKLAVERHEQRAEHVERRHKRRDYPKRVQERPKPGFGMEYARENLVLAPEPRRREYPRERQAAYQEGEVSPRHRLLQPAHIAHVEGAGGVVDRPRPQEQQRLEEGVGEQVEYGEGVCARSERQHHVTELAHG